MSVLVSVAIISVLVASTIGEQPQCKVVISELNPDVPGQAVDEREFIELQTDCSTANRTVSLDDYSLVVWTGPKTFGGSANVEFMWKLNGRNFERGSPYFVLASPPYAKKLQKSLSAKVVSFSDFKNSGQIQHRKNNLDKPVEYLNNGNQRSIAVCLYRKPDLETLSVGVPLDERTAQFGQLVDVVVYHKAGSGRIFIERFFPEWFAPGADTAKLVVLKDLGEPPELDELNVTKYNDFSLSSCCKDGPLRGKWPLGFKITNPTPGESNDCDQSKHGYVIKNFGRGVKLADNKRCDYENLPNFLRSIPRPPQASSDHHKKRTNSDLPAFGPDSPDYSNDGPEVTKEAVSNVQHALLEPVQQTLDQLRKPEAAANTAAMESTERQVTLLAVVVGVLVSVGTLTAIVVGYCYFKQRRLIRTPGFSRSTFRAVPRTSIDDDGDEVHFDRRQVYRGPNAQDMM